MRILFVAFPESIHTVRWINQVSDQGWDIHLFPARRDEFHPKFKNLTTYGFSTFRPPGLNPSVRWRQLWPRRGTSRLSMLAARFDPWWLNRSAWLARLIRQLKPDIVHSLEMQQSAYLTLDAIQMLGGDAPPWFVSSWGNDLYLFGRLTEHASKIRAVLGACDYFTADCNRDVDLARQYGFKGEAFPALPGAGGFDIELIKQLRPQGLTSARRMIALKGYQHWYGRALTGLSAIERCADVLQDYRVAIYFPNTDVIIAAELMSQRTGIKVEIVPHGSYEDSLRLHGRARVSVSVNISDGLPLSTMEAALMGSFPVQTNTSCVGERLSDGLGTFLVPPDNIEQIATAIRRAVTDDELVDRAAETNFRYISENLGLDVVRSQVVAMYEKIYAGSQSRG